MKYIRTEAGEIYDINDLYICEELNGKPYGVKNNGWVIYKESILKQANTIKELCDEFVYKKRLFNRIEKGKDLENQIRIRVFGISFFDLYIEEWKDIYGAIWTDKGLIYVAKMNDKGEFELL